MLQTPPARFRCERASWRVAQRAHHAPAPPTTLPCCRMLQGYADPLHEQLRRGVGPEQVELVDALSTRPPPRHTRMPKGLDAAQLAEIER